MAVEARKAIERLLKSGPKTGEELRRKYLGARPNDPKELTVYNTNYQSVRRALESMIEEGLIVPPTYRLSGEAADQGHIQTSMQSYSETADSAKRHFLLEFVEAECRKRNAILTPRLLIFLKSALSDETEKIRKLAIDCLRDITSKISESRREDLRHLKRLREDYTDKLLDIVTQDPSNEVMIEALKLLIEFGELDTITVIAHILTDFPKENFAQFKSVLTTDLFVPYDESASRNRLLRDYKDQLRDMLTNLRLGTDPRTMRRAEILSWKLKHGPTSIMAGGEDMD
jgi:hypothetical protein